MCNTKRSLTLVADVEELVGGATACVRHNVGGRASEHEVLEVSWAHGWVVAQHDCGGTCD